MNTDPPPVQCTVNCTGVDLLGNTWTGCAGIVSTRNCSNNAYGQATWKCLPTGKFEGDSPDITNCTTVWIQKIESELENVSTQIHTLHFLTYSINLLMSMHLHSISCKYRVT